MKNPGNGFTLLEMLVVVGIFALIGLSAGQLLNETLLVDSRIKYQATRFGDLLRAVQRIEQDIEQIAMRGVKDISGESLPPVAGGPGHLHALEFTRHGWSNPLNHKRSQLQRVAYRMHDGKVQRFFWNVLDRAEVTRPQQQLILEDVSAFDIRFINGEGEETSFWPQGRSYSGSHAGNGNEGLAEQEKPENRLSAIELRLELEPYGVIRRLFPVMIAAPAEIEVKSDDP